MGAEAAMGASLLSGGAQMYGNAKEAKALRANAKAIDAERAATEEVFNRRLFLLQRDQDKYIGSLESAFARSGIDFSGTMLNIYAETKDTMKQEQAALLAEAAQTDRRLASQAGQLRQQASNLTSTFTMATTLLGTGLDAGSSYYRARGA